MDAANAAMKEIMGEGGSVCDPAIVRVLEGVLAAAKAGRVRGVAVIEVGGPERIGMQVAGGHLPAMVAGAVQLQRILTDEVFRVPRGGGLLVPGGMGRG